jgi:hypothetical protein
MMVQHGAVRKTGDRKRNKWTNYERTLSICALNFKEKLYEYQRNIPISAFWLSRSIKSNGLKTLVLLVSTT